MAKLDMHTWGLRDALELYNVEGWGGEYFGINDRGDLVVHPKGPSGPRVDLKELADDLVKRGLAMPLLIRFSDILASRVAVLCEAFRTAIAEYGYKAPYRAVMPIKVNQQRHVVEEILHFGRPYNVGLEAGSKPELLVALAMVEDPEALIICNGYKDSEYVETALLARKLGRNCIIVIDRYEEADMAIAAARKLGIRPVIGARAKLAARGAGRWNESSGERSKFGLTTTEMVRLVDKLREHDMLDCLQLLHFHIGSQITTIRAIKDALREAGRFYVSLATMGANMRYIDVGGGLAVDYDGSRSNFHSSRNYSEQEYANDVVSVLMDICDESEVPHPVIVSESGRALVAHHSVLLFNVLGVNELVPQSEPEKPGEEDHRVLSDLYDAFHSVTRKRYQEAYHDAVTLRDEAIQLFNHGMLNLQERARAEALTMQIFFKILRTTEELDYVPDDLADLPANLSDTYFCNFSIFQSVPDHWAVKHLFPVMPIHRLNERPTRRGVLVDVTCDSDGKMDEFIDLRDVRDWLPMHPLNGQPYYLGVFLLGAYQEILGDLHNLFGDTHTVHVDVTDSGYTLKHVVEGDSVNEVLGYVEYSRADLIARVRMATEQSLREGRISLEESRALMQRYDSSLSGYTYLEEDDLPWEAPAR